MNITLMLFLMVVVRGTAVVLRSPKAGECSPAVITKRGSKGVSYRLCSVCSPFCSAAAGGEGVITGAGTAVATLLDAMASPPRCSVVLITDSPSSSFAFLKEMAEVGAPWTASVLHGGNFTHLVQTARLVRRRSWCVTVVVASRDPLFLSSFAHHCRRGRLLQWGTKAVVATPLESLRQLRDVMRSHWAFSMMNSLAIGLRRDSSWDVYSWLPYTSVGSRMVLTAFWSPKTGLVGSSDSFFPEKFANFHGASIPVASVQLLPLFDIIEREEPDGSTALEYIGREFLMLSEIARRLNFTPEIRKTSSITEAVKTLVTGEAMLVPVRIMLLPMIVEAVDYTFHVDRSTFTFAMAKPPIKPRWEGSYYPFAPEVWLAILVTFFLLPPVFLAVLHAGGGTRMAPEAQRIAFEVYGVLLAQDLLRRLPQTTSVRFLVSAWMVFALIMGTSYKGNLTAFLTIPKYPERPETLDQLAEAKVHSKFTRNVTWFHDYFTTSPVRSSRSVGDRSSLVDDRWEGMLYVRDTRGAFFFERYNFMLMIAGNFTASDGWSPLYVARENVLPNYSCWLLPHDAPYKENLDKILARITEAGLKEKWMDDVMGDIMRDDRRRKRENEEWKAMEEIPSEVSSNTQQPLAVTHLQGPFFLLVLGLFVSVCTFFQEIFPLMSIVRCGKSY